MSVNRRDLLTASALLLGGPALSLRLAAAPEAAPALLCWNENPYGPSPAARRAVARSIAEGCRYPSVAEIEDLEHALARHEGTDVEHIVTGTGSGELLCALGLVFGRDGGEFLAAQLDLPGAARVRQEPGGEHALCAGRRPAAPRSARHARGGRRAHARGVPVQPEQSHRHGAAGRRHPRVRGEPASRTWSSIVDEAYMDFTTANGVCSVRELVDGQHPVIVLRTFSKIHGMAGLRMGYAIAPPPLAKSLRQARMSFPNIFAVRAAPREPSLDDQEFLTRARVSRHPRQPHPHHDAN